MLEVERTGQHVAEAYRFAGNPGDTSLVKRKRTDSRIRILRTAVGD